jgi:hypothetical protein
MLTRVVELHSNLISIWERNGIAPPMCSIDQLIAAQHRHNYNLWQLENLARTPSIVDAKLAEVKRAIDAENQRRNDAVQHVDTWLYEAASRRVVSDGAPLHSESPGLMIDRLSILALKVFYTKAEMTRVDAPLGHAAKMASRLEVLREQRKDLSQCLSELWEAVLRGERRFKIYQQLKMYNDPELNPAIYGSKERSV